MKKRKKLIGILFIVFALIAGALWLEWSNKLKPVEAEISTFEEFEAIWWYAWTQGCTEEFNKRIPGAVFAKGYENDEDSLPITDKCKIKGIRGIELKIQQSYMKCSVDVFKNGDHAISLENLSCIPILIKNEEGIYLYAETDHRSLCRVDLLADEIVLESDVIWDEFPSDDIANCCAKEYNSNYFGRLGEKQNDDGTWNYAVYRDGNEMATVKSSKRLFFKADEGIAVDEDGNLYMLYYSSYPYSLRAFKVNLPEKVDLEKGDWRIEKTDESYCCAVVDTATNQYVIKTSQLEARQRNGMDYLEYCLEPLETEPIFKVYAKNYDIEDFEEYSTGFDAEEKMFYISSKADTEVCSQCNSGGKIFLKEEIEKNFLGCVVPKSYLEKVWFKDYSSWEETKTAIYELNQALDEWAEENPLKVQNYFLENPEEIENYPEEAAKYDIVSDGGDVAFTIQ